MASNSLVIDMSTTFESVRPLAMKDAGERLDRDVLALLDDSLAHFEATGLHLSLDDLKAWRDAVKTNPSAQLPACHV
jgi:hypothetical protein